MRLFLSFIILVLSSSLAFAFDDISAERKMELDSFVTYLEKPILRNLDSLHNRIHHFGKNDEERVWMFYGYFGVHTQYDMNRFYKRKNQEYTPGYTCYSGSGVCRDFAHLFKALCIKSDIKCDVATGEAKIPFLIKLKLFFTLKFDKMKGGHAWNVVKYNDKWHLMDVTWSGIKEVKKNYRYDKKGNKTLISKIHIPDREYYNSIPDNFIKDHRPYNPVHTLMEEIPTFKTAFKLPHKQDVYPFDYQLDSILNSSFALPYNTMNDGFIKYSGAYCGGRAGHTVSDHDDWLFRKTAPKARPTLDELYCYRDSIIIMYDDLGHSKYENTEKYKSLYLRILMIEKTGSNQLIERVINGN